MNSEAFEHSERQVSYASSARKNNPETPLSHLPVPPARECAGRGSGDARLRGRRRIGSDGRELARFRGEDGGELRFGRRGATRDARRHCQGARCERREPGRAGNRRESSRQHLRRRRRGRRRRCQAAAGGRRSSAGRHCLFSCQKEERGRESVYLFSRWSGSSLFLRAKERAFLFQLGFGPCSLLFFEEWEASFGSEILRARARGEEKEKKESSPLSLSLDQSLFFSFDARRAIVMAPPAGATAEAVSMKQRSRGTKEGERKGH